MSADSPFLPEDERDEDPLPVPWGFRFTLIAAFIYLGYRFIQGIAWLIDRL